MRYRAGCAFIVGLLVCGTAEPFGGRTARPAMGFAGYSYHVPVVAAPMWVMPAPAAVPHYCPTTIPVTPRIIPLSPTTSPAIPFAPTRPAPPSKTIEPPLGTKEPPLGKTTSHTGSEPGKRAPQIVEARGPVIAPPIGKETCKVGFWNVSGRDVELVIAGKKHTLEKDRAITLELNRHFSWNLAGQPAAQERVPEDKAFHEIVLRN